MCGLRLSIEGGSLVKSIFSLIVERLFSQTIFFCIITCTTFILFSLVYPNMGHENASTLQQVSLEMSHFFPRLLKTE